jgi:hypothetical protein
MISNNWDRYKSTNDPTITGVMMRKIDKKQPKCLQWSNSYLHCTPAAEANSSPE